MPVIPVGCHPERVESRRPVINRDLPKGIVEIKGVVVEGSEYIPASNVVYYLSDQRRSLSTLFPVSISARRKIVLQLPLRGIVLATDDGGFKNFLEFLFIMVVHVTVHGSRRSFGVQGIFNLETPTSIFIEIITRLDRCIEIGNYIGRAFKTWRGYT